MAFLDYTEEGWLKGLQKAQEETGNFKKLAKEDQKPRSDDDKTREKNFWDFIEDIKEAKFEYRLMRTDGHIIVSVRVADPVLQKIADDIDFEVPLDSKVLEKLSKEGLPKYSILPFPIRDDKTVTKFNPFEHVYGRYDTSDELQPLYTGHPDGSSVFPPLTRSKLVLKLLEGLAQATDETSDTEVGATSTSLDDLIDDKLFPLLAYFPLHNVAQRDMFDDKWLSWCYLPWNQPLQHVREYFGEKVAMYFAFLGHYAASLMVLALFGVAGFVFEVLNDYDPDTVVLPYLGVIVAVWGVVMLEVWKRRQAYIALEWGMLNFTKTELPRKEFNGTVEISVENGRPEVYFAAKKRQCRVCVAAAVVGVMLSIVLGAVAMVYVVQHLCRHSGSEFWETNASTVSGLLSSVQIQVMNVIYRGVAIRLNDYENFRTDTQYEHALVTKIFVFQVINSYASLTYIAFKQHDLCIGSCMLELRAGLMSIFLAGLFISNMVEVGVPWAMNKVQIYRSGKDPKKAIPKTGEEAVAREFFVLDEYDIILGQIDDYSELVIQFGYCTFFVVAFPLAPVLALATCWIEIRSDAYKMLRVCRRAIPSGAQNIGPWAEVLSVMVRLSVVSNGVILCWTSHYLEEELDMNEVDKLHVFLVYIGLIFVLLYFIDYVIDDVPAEVAIQHSRIDFIVQKLIDHLPDEDATDDDDTKTRRVSTFKRPSGIPDMGESEADDTTGTGEEKEESKESKAEPAKVKAEPAKVDKPKVVYGL